MQVLINNTGKNSKVGYLCKLDPSDNNAFIYAGVNPKGIFGVVTENVIAGAPCKITTPEDEFAYIFIIGVVHKGDDIRAVKSTDSGTDSTGIKVADTDSNYLHIGTALVFGRGLVKCSLAIAYVAVGINAYVPYTGATRDVNLGTRALTAGSEIIGDADNHTAFATNGRQTMAGTARGKNAIWVDAGGLRAPGLKPATYVEHGLSGAWQFSNAVAGSEESVSGI